MIGSRFTVRFAHYDGLAANEVVEELRALEQEAGRPSDLGWVSEAMFEPTFALVTLARDQRMRGYAAATRTDGCVRLQRLVTATDPDFPRTRLGAALVDAMLRVNGHPPYRSLLVPAGFDALPLLERVGWQIVHEGPPRACERALTLRKRSR